MKKNVQRKKGFSLVEMTVSLGLFTIIMFMATSAFLNLVRADRKTRSVRIAMDNLNITLEDMSRRIKTGSNYYCGLGGEALSTPLDCLGGGNTLSFNDQGGARITYSLSGTSIVRDGMPITSPEITINNLSFLVSNSLPLSLGDTKQPMVVASIDGSVGTGETQTSFNIQTTITQRAHDSE